MLSKNIVRLRKRFGWTQIEFAKRLHVTQAAVSFWETGRSLPDTFQLFKIAELFGVSIDELTDNVPPATPEPRPKPSEDLRSEAKKLLEGMNDEQYRAALQYLKFLAQDN